MCPLIFVDETLIFEFPGDGDDQRSLDALERSWELANPLFIGRVESVATQ